VITVICVALMLTGLISGIYLINELSKRSRREQGLPKKEKKPRGNHEK